MASSSDCCHCSSPSHQSKLADDVRRRYVETAQKHFTANSTTRSPQDLSIASTSPPYMIERQVELVGPFGSGGMVHIDTRCKPRLEVGVPNFTANQLLRHQRSNSSYCYGCTSIAVIDITVIEPTYSLRCQKAVTTATGSVGFGQLDCFQLLLLKATVDPRLRSFGYPSDSSQSRLADFFANLRRSYHFLG